MSSLCIHDIWPTHGEIGTAVLIPRNMSVYVHGKSPSTAYNNNMFVSLQLIWRLSWLLTSCCLSEGRNGEELSSLTALSNWFYLLYLVIHIHLLDDLLFTSGNAKRCMKKCGLWKLFEWLLDLYLTSWFTAGNAVTTNDKPVRVHQYQIMQKRL